MKKFVFRRILSGLLTVLVVFTLNFALVKSAPGDPITSLMGKETDDPVLRQALMEKWGLDKSYPEQYLSYLKNAASGDLGTSIIYNRSVNEMIGERVLATVLLGLTAALLALLLGTALGIFCARRSSSIPSLTTSPACWLWPVFPSPPSGWG